MSRELTNRRIKRNWVITEDWEKRLSLFVWEDGKLIYSHTGYENYEDYLRDDLHTLKNSKEIIGGNQKMDLKYKIEPSIKILFEDSILV